MDIVLGFRALGGSPEPRGGRGEDWVPKKDLGDKGRKQDKGEGGENLQLTQEPKGVPCVKDTLKSKTH